MKNLLVILLMALNRLSAMDDALPKQNIQIASINVIKDRSVALRCCNIAEKTDLYRMAACTVSQQELNQILKKTCEEYAQVMKKPFNKAHEVVAMMECRQKRKDLELALKGNCESKPKNIVNLYFS